MIHIFFQATRIFGLSLFLLGTIVAGSVAQQMDKSDEVRLAIKGYDPVAYFTMGRPAKGKSELHYDLDGVRYQFVSGEHLKMFRREPDRYAPRFRGLCAMGLGAKGYKVAANPENWVIHEGRLYMTQRDFGPPIFKKSPERWAAAATAHLSELEDAPIGTGISWW